MFDFVGVLALILLVGLFGFLTVRAWPLKSRLLKWGGVGLGGLLTVVAAALLVVALTGFYQINRPHDNPVAAVNVAGTAAQIARGQQLAHICASCHSPDGQLPLAGVNFAVKFGLPPIGTFYAPNLTPAGNLQGWTDGEIIRAIREGIHKNGRSLIVMTAADFRYMSDDDVQAVVAYLRAQPPTGEPMPENKLNVLGAVFVNLAGFLTAQAPVGQVTAPEPGTPAYGEYLVNVIGCRDCHGDQLQGKLDSGQPGPPPGPNLTQILPNWTEDQFLTFFNMGLRPDGSPVPPLTLPDGSTEPRMPWSMVRASTTDAELHDLYTYLHSLPPAQGPSQ